MTEFKPGDRVRVRLDVLAVIDGFQGAEIEKVEPPFGPGDVIREKVGDWVGLLGETGWLSLKHGQRYVYGTRSIEDLFPVEDYERLTTP